MLSLERTSWILCLSLAGACAGGEGSSATEGASATTGEATTSSAATGEATTSGTATSAGESDATGGATTGGATTGDATTTDATTTPTATGASTTGEATTGGDAGAYCDGAPAGRCAASIAAGYVHVCLRREDGGVICWGEGHLGLLGRGDARSFPDDANIGDDDVPSDYDDVAFGAEVLDVAAGAGHNCAVLAGGGVRCWGGALDGKLGYADEWESLGDDEAMAMIPDVSVGGPAVAVTAHWNHSCALLEGGGVRCWGAGGQGKLGYGVGLGENIGDDEVPSESALIDVGGTVVALSAGGSHTCALLDSAELRCWGINTYGQLGQPDYAHLGVKNHPAEAGSIDVGGPVLAVDTGQSHTCVLLEGGDLRCWGRNHYGQLGLGHTDDLGGDAPPSTIPLVDVGGAVVDFSVGVTHTCAILEGGDVRCWGENWSGKLGLGDGSEGHIGDDEVPASVAPVDVGAPAVAISAGWQHTCVMIEGGGVRCWGNNSHGQLGYGNTTIIGDDESPAVAGDVPYL